MSSSSENDQSQTSSALVPLENRFELTANNMVFDADFTRTEFPIIDAVLRAHPFYHMLRHEPDVPLIYIHQVWSSLHIVQEENRPLTLTGALTNQEIHITESNLRRALRLPQRDVFEALPTREEISQMIVQLGYHGPLPPHLSSLQRRNFAAMWCTILTVINKCTTWKHTGYDKHSTNVLNIWLAIAFDRHYNIAKLIFDELVLMVSYKGTDKQKPMVPFPRFLAMVIERFLNRNAFVSRRPESARYVSPKIVKIGNDVGTSHIIAAPIPEHLLARLDQDLAIVRDYRLTVAQMPQLPPGAIDPRNPPPAPRGPRAPAPRAPAPRAPRAPIPQRQRAPQPLRAPAPRAPRAPIPQRQRAPQPQLQAPAPPILQRGPGPNILPRNPQQPSLRPPLLHPIHPAPHRPRHIPPQLQPRPEPLLLLPPPLPITHPDQPSSSTAIPPQPSSQHIPSPRPIFSLFNIESDSSENTPPATPLIRHHRQPPPPPPINSPSQPSPHQSPIGLSSDELSDHTSIAEITGPQSGFSIPIPDPTETYNPPASPNPESPNPSINMSSPQTTPSKSQTTDGNIWDLPSHTPSLSTSFSPLLIQPAAHEDEPAILAAALNNEAETQQAELRAEPSTDREAPPSGGRSRRQSGNPAAGVQRPPSPAGSGPAHATGSDAGSTGFLRGNTGNVAPAIEALSTTELKSALLSRLNAQDSLDPLDLELRDVLHRGTQTNIPQSPRSMVQHAAEMLRSLAASLDLSVTATCRGDQGKGKRSRDDPDDQDPREGEIKRQRVAGSSRQRHYLHKTSATETPHQQQAPTPKQTQQEQTSPPKPTDQVEKETSPRKVQDIPTNVEVSVDPTQMAIPKSQTASITKQIEVAGPSSRVPKERTSGQLLDDYLYDVHGKKPMKMDAETAKWYDDMISPTGIVHSTLTEGERQRRRVLQEQFQAVHAVSVEQRIQIENQVNENLPYFEFMILGMFATKQNFLKSDLKSHGLLANEVGFFEDIKAMLATKKQDRTVAMFFKNDHIKKLKRVSVERFRGIVYPVFTVERASGVKSTFSEADFSQLNPDDLLNLHTILLTLAPESNRKNVALRSIYRFFRGQLYEAAHTDLHFCLHTTMRKLVFTAPNTEIPTNSKHEFGRLYSIGADIGLCFQDHNKKAVMVRKSELAKFSNGTLKMIREMLSAQIGLNLPHDQGSLVPGVYRDMAEDLFQAVTKRIDHRAHLICYFAIISEVDKDLVNP